MNTPIAVKSASRVLDLLEVLATATGPVGAAELARRLGIPKSSAHMLLSTLEGRRYVVGDEMRRFRLHPMYGADRRSWVGGTYGVLRALAHEAMDKLARTTGESSFLGVRRDHTSFEYIEKEVSRHEVRCDAELGQRRALHASSIGLVLLAFGDPAEAKRYLTSHALERLTPRTMCEPVRLRRELAAIHKQGYAVTRDTNAIGASGIAVPIFDGDGHAIAGLNISAPTSRFDAVVKDAAKELIRAAKAITAQLASAPAARSKDEKMLALR
jgi:DNA-binding IclR family transcriptional regulator